MRKHKLIIASLLAILLLALIAGVGMAGKFPPTGNNPRCTTEIQSGRIDLVVDDEIGLVEVPLEFKIPFCETPVVVASAGENVSEICVVKVSEDGAWLVFEGTPSEPMQVFWMATVPTQ